MDLPSREDVELEVKTELGCLGARAKESLFGLHSLLLFHPRLYCERTRVAGCGNPFHILMDAVEPSGSVRVVGDCPWYSEARIVEVPCVPVVRGFVVGNRPAGFPEAPVHDRVVGEDYIPVSCGARGSIFPEILIKGTGISTRSYIPFAADSETLCKASSITPEVSLLCPGIGGGVVFPEILKAASILISACSNIPF